MPELTIKVTVKDGKVNYTRTTNEFPINDIPEALKLINKDLKDEMDRCAKHSSKEGMHPTPVCKLTS